MKMRKIIRRIYGIVYKTTNNINGKIYIGKDTKNSHNYLGSGKYFRNAIKKCGRENFTKITIDIANNKLELNEKEIFWIKFYDARNPEIGYNILEGGEGVGSGEEHPFYGKHRSIETKQKLSLANAKERHPLYGKRLSEEHRIKISLALKGRISPMKGKKLTEDTKKRISESNRGENHPLWGKHHSEETKLKMSLSKIGKSLK